MATKKVKKPYSDYDMSKRNRRGLTPRQEAFVRYYCTPGPTLYNATQSAIAAGYTKASAHSSGHRNLRQPPIEAAIQKHLREAYSGSELTVESVLAKLEELRRVAMRDGKLAAAARAIEMQGRYLKMFMDRVEHMHKIEDASTAELVDLLKSVVTNVEGLSFEDLMESVGGTVDSSSAGDGAGESSDSHREGAAPAD